uniref:Transposase, Ptta/En/Spm, plant n=1 Tax=Helianthus annuus TaxID=4232 RepID=A0A251VNX5_HELAN
MKRYSDRKYEAKKLFKSKGGYNDLESARAFHPPDMPYDNWLRTIEGFREEKYIKRSKANTLVREKQQFPYRGGTSSYGSTAYKNNMDWVPTYAKTHTDNQGNWVDPVAEQNYVSISFKYYFL